LSGGTDYEYMKYIHIW